jgi:nitrite reductase/ring-hydroxylating ferredoxin subunit
MPDFAEVARLDQTTPGTGTVVTVAGSAVALFNVEGRLFAVDDSCVRCGSSLASGTLHGVAVACPGCDWSYDVTSGCVNGVPALCIDTFEVRVEDSRVMVANAPACYRR